ncbi:MAG: M4 family metallopeptidase [Pseudonocardiaceae bacterium]
MTRAFHPVNCITPPHILNNLLESADQDIREAALSTLLSNARLAGERTVRASFAAAAPAGGRRTIFDCKNSTFLPSGVLARSEDGAKSADNSVNQAFDGLGTTRQFYKDIHGRDSIDDRGMRLDGYVHRGRNYNNAFWDGQRMVFGDGDGKIFTDFTGSLDVIAHELTHGVTEHTAGLEYHTQSGALNEHISDVFGCLVKQWSRQQSAEEADWLIGSEVFTPGIEADALRSLKAPGKAYDNSTFGKDPQPDHMSKFVHLPDTDEGDNGGVHINSGIPNKAFYLAAVGIGGFAWKAPGHIWYEALKASSVRTQFQEFADTTYFKAEELYGAGSVEQQAVLAAWREVGIRISGVPAAAQARAGEDSLAALTRQIEALSTQVKALTDDVRAFTAQK